MKLLLRAILRFLSNVLNYLVAFLISGLGISIVYYGFVQLSLTTPSTWFNFIVAILIGCVAMGWGGNMLAELTVDQFYR